MLFKVMMLLMTSMSTQKMIQSMNMSTFMREKIVMMMMEMDTVMMSMLMIMRKMI